MSRKVHAIGGLGGAHSSRAGYTLCGRNFYGSPRAAGLVDCYEGADVTRSAPLVDCSICADKVRYPAWSA